MAQFDVFVNVNRSTNALYAYLVDIQSNLLFDLRTTVVIPLTPAKDYVEKPIENLHPIFDISRQQYLLMTTLIAGIDRSSLGKKVFSLEESRDEIIASLDFMITGI
jgi:toxin CcdB